MNKKSTNSPKKVLTLNKLVDNPSENEVIKDKSDYLRGSILEDINVQVTANIQEDNAQLTKFHGTYIQDNRDTRLERQQKKLEPEWGFMIRVRIPAGSLSADQWIKMDDLANNWAGHKLKLTTRQAIQFHGIIKFDLKKSMQAIYQAGMDSIAACGDVNRNVMCTSVYSKRAFHQQALSYASKISEHLLPETTAWYDIWIDGEKQKSKEVRKEAMYGKHYLPRKFKIAITIPPFNDVDVYANDIGLIAIEKDNNLAGFNILAGGGLGTTHSDDATYPRLATALGFCKPEQVNLVCENIMTIQRDYGNRSVRKNARLKYTMDRLGVDWFKQELENRCGFKLTKSQAVEFEHNGDYLGWLEDDTKQWHLVVPIEYGQVYDSEIIKLKTALREIAEQDLCEFRLTGNQNLALVDVQQKSKAKVNAIFKKHGYNTDAKQQSGMRRHAVACVALPTCALAMAEAQRYLPELITKIEAILKKNNLFDEDINIRMTGCPNGCGRPWLGEIGFIGKSMGRYNFYLGASFDGTRLNTLYKENVNEATILSELEVMLKNYAKKRYAKEHFGDYLIRSKVIKPFQAPV